jgi:hypothetical protein
VFLSITVSHAASLVISLRQALHRHLFRYIIFHIRLVYSYSDALMDSIAMLGEVISDIPLDGHDI